MHIPRISLPPLHSRLATTDWPLLLPALILLIVGVSLALLGG